MRLDFIAWWGTFIDRFSIIIEESSYFIYNRQSLIIEDDAYPVFKIVFKIQEILLTERTLIWKNFSTSPSIYFKCGIA